jgi:hypothetical protein
MPTSSPLNVNNMKTFIHTVGVLPDQHTTSLLCYPSEPRPGALVEERPYPPVQHTRTARVTTLTRPRQGTRGKDTRPLGARSGASHARTRAHPHAPRRTHARAHGGGCASFYWSDPRTILHQNLAQATYEACTYAPARCYTSPYDTQPRPPYAHPCRFRRLPQQSPSRYP